MAQQLFVPGQTYLRRALHAQYGGQQQGGISTPAKYPFILLITGHSGAQYGYKDGWSDDGTVFRYTGEGQLGDMQFIKGNRAVRDHEKDRKALYLFEQRSKGFITYTGEMVYVNAEYVDAPDQKGRQRKAIVFKLQRASGATASEIRGPASTSQATLSRERAYWAFVANPSVYRVQDVLERETDDYWTVKHSDVRRGDRAAIWKAKGTDKNRGVVAFAEVISDPELTDIPPGRKNYWVDGKSRGLARRVRIEYVLPPAVPLWLSSNDASVLSEMSVSRATGGGVFTIDPDQWRRLLVIAGGWPQQKNIEDAVLEAAEQASVSARKQAFSADPETRRVVEEYAVARARQYFEEQQFAVEIHGKPFDLCCRKGGSVVFVEVKGTQTTGEEILLTPNEVTFATRHPDQMALFVVHDVIVSRKDGKPIASGGGDRVRNPWSLDTTRLTPLGFSYLLES
jgi:hypothetical protein